MGFRNPRGRWVWLIPIPLGKAEEKMSFLNKIKHMVLGIKFQTYTTLISFLIPNPYHYMNQTPPKRVFGSYDFGMRYGFRMSKTHT